MGLLQESTKLGVEKLQLLTTILNPKSISST